MKGFNFLAPLLTISCALTMQSCAQHAETKPDQSTLSNIAEPNIFDAETLDWVRYADPRADVNLAIEKQDYALLAFANRAINLPGIDTNKHTVESLQKKCSLRFVKGSGDALTQDTNMELRKILRTYATEYNQLMLMACFKK